MKVTRYFFHVFKIACKGMCISVPDREYKISIFVRLNDSNNGATFNVNKPLIIVTLSVIQLVADTQRAPDKRSSRFLQKWPFSHWLVHYIRFVIGSGWRNNDNHNSNNNNLHLVPRYTGRVFVPDISRGYTRQLLLVNMRFP